jgi:hypothetical protein
MFVLFAVFIAMATGETHVVQKDGVSFKTFAECAAALPAELMGMPNALARHQGGVVVALGCAPAKRPEERNAESP